jgi:effector-binding domain-containing protein
MMHLRVLFLAIAVASLGAPGHALAQGTVHTQPIDPFGQEVTLAEKPILYATGTGEWDTAYATLKESFKTLQDYLDKAGIKAAGPRMTIYTAMDDVSFNYQAAIPLAAAPSAALPGNIGTGTSPAGKALKFVHRGSFENMTQTYDAISHFVDEKQGISTKELLIEEYVTDLLSAPADKLVINIFVPLN